MNKPLTPPDALSPAPRSPRTGDTLRRKPQAGDEAVAGEEAVASEEGVAAAEAADAAGAGRAGAAGLGEAGSAAAGAAPPVAATAGAAASAGAVGSWFTSLTTWIGLGAAGAGLAVGHYRDGEGDGGGGGGGGDGQTAPVVGDVVVGGSDADGSLTGQVGGSDADGDTLTFSVVGTPPAGLTFNPDGSFSYAPQPADDALDDGETRTLTFQYVASDGSTSSAPATVTLTVTGSNDAPVASATVTSGSEGDGIVTGAVLGSDVDGEPLTYALVGTAPDGLTFNPDGTYVYVPQPADLALGAGEQNTITFEYVVNDGTVQSAPATVTITVNGVNDAPVSGGDATASGAADDASINGRVPTANDTDSDSLRYALLEPAPEGLTFNADGSYRYVPHALDQALDDGETRTVTFQYVASDGSADSAPATVTLTITGANDAPVSSGNAAVSRSEDDAVIAGSVPVASDVDGEALSYHLVGTAPEGVTFNPDGTFFVTPLATDQGLDEGESRVITFDYVAYDGTANSTPATVTITIAGANDAPVSGGAAAASGSEDDAVISGSVPAATDVDGEALTYALTAAAPPGVLFNPDGTFSYTPSAADAALDSGESRQITFQYVAADGTVESALATVTITVHGVNDAPVSGGDATASGAEDDTSINGRVPIASDVDGEALTYALVDSAPAGVTFNPDGSFAVTPLATDQGLDEGESRTLTFDYVAHDGTVNSAPGTVTVTITGVNDAPVAGGNATAAGNEDDLAITGSVPAGTDADGEALTYAVFGSTPAGLTLNADGSFRYVPQAADAALDDTETRQVTFQYVAYDGAASSAPATVTITLAGANDAPVAGAAAAGGSEDDAVISGSVPAATDVDGEAAPLTYALSGSVPAGLIFNPDGTFSYTPQASDQTLRAGESRQLSFDYVANDGSASSAPATVTITIAGANDAPLANGPTNTRLQAIGPEFQVNTYTLDAQLGAGVAGLSDGSFVVTWTSYGQDGAGGGVYGQRYAADGSTVGAEFRINNVTGGPQIAASVAALAEGGFVVSWQSPDGAGYGIFARRYGADGTAQGSEFRVNTTIGGDQYESALTALADGGFVITWMASLTGGGSLDVYAQRFAADGSKAGDELRINTTTFQDQYLPDLTALADGGFVVTWVSFLQDGSDNGIYGQRYAADGSTVGAEFRVNTATFGSQYNAAVTALPDGGFVVTWQSSDGSNLGIYGQRYAADGSTVGGEFRVNTTTASDQYGSAVTALPDGGFVVTWQSPDGSSFGIFGQRFAADGSRVDGEFRVNTTTSNLQVDATLQALADGDLVVTWTALGQDGSNEGVFAQRYTLVEYEAPPPVVTEGAAVATASAQLAVSDIDASDTHTWSITNSSAYGQMTIAQDGTWTFTLDKLSPATKALAAGATLTETFTATVTDSAGASDTQSVSVIILGAAGDYLVGDAGANTLSGGSATDLFDGGAGNDRLTDTTASNDGYVYRYGRDGYDVITEAGATVAGSAADVLEIWLAPADGGAVDFTLAGGDDLFIQVGNDPAQGILIQDFFAADGSGTLNADIEQITLYADNGVTQIASVSSEEIQAQFFG